MPEVLRAPTALRPARAADAGDLRPYAARHPDLRRVRQPRLRPAVAPPVRVPSDRRPAVKRPRLTGQWRAFLMASALHAHLEYVRAERHRTTTALMVRALGLTWKEI